MIQETTILAPDYKGAVGSADIHISPDGLFLYATNRGEANTITIFKILSYIVLKMVRPKNVQLKSYLLILCILLLLQTTKKINKKN